MEVTCSFCGGHGTDPFGIMSWLSTCCVCGGRGVVQVPASHRRCAHCQGTGAIKTFTCTVCRGTGYVPVTPRSPPGLPGVPGQRGRRRLGPGLQTCRGRGWVPRESV